jgi:hypothetical protein
MVRACHAVRVPCVTSVEGLIQAAAGLVVADVDLAAEPAAAAAAQQSLDDSGLLLLGEMHGARENLGGSARVLVSLACYSE